MSALKQLEDGHEDALTIATSALRQIAFGNVRARDTAQEALHTLGFASMAPCPHEAALADIERQLQYAFDGELTDVSNWLWVEAALEVAKRANA